MRRVLSEKYPGRFGQSWAPSTSRQTPKHDKLTLEEFGSESTDKKIATNKFTTKESKPSQVELRGTFVVKTNCLAQSQIDIRVRVTETCRNMSQPELSHVRVHRNVRVPRRTQIMNANCCAREQRLPELQEQMSGCVVVVRIGFFQGFERNHAAVKQKTMGCLTRHVREHFLHCFCSNSKHLCRTVHYSTATGRAKPRKETPMNYN